MYSVVEIMDLEKISSNKKFDSQIGFKNLDIIEGKVLRKATALDLNILKIVRYILFCLTVACSKNNNATKY